MEMSPWPRTQCQSWACCICSIFLQAKISIFLCPATCLLPSPEVFGWLSAHRADLRLQTKLCRKEKQFKARWFGLAVLQAAALVNLLSPGYFCTCSLFLWGEEWRHCHVMVVQHVIQNVLLPHNFFVFLMCIGQARQNPLDLHSVLNMNDR